MKNLMLAWIISFLVIMGIDAIWLTLTVKSFYKPLLSHLFKEDLSYFTAILFYIMYSFGLSYLIIIPNLENKNMLEIFLRGFMIGLMAYGAYDLTNQATLKDWPLMITIVDMLWGSLLTGLASFLTLLIIRKI